MQLPQPGLPEDAVAVRRNLEEAALAGQIRQPVALRYVDRNTGSITLLATGSDFFAGLALSGQSDRLAWLTWDLPDMPWDRTRLWTADIGADGSLVNVAEVPTPPACATTASPGPSP